MLSAAGALSASGPGGFWVWLRNATVWRRSWRTSLVGSVGEPWPGVLCLGLILLAGLIFSCLGMIVTSVARGYDSFNYYFTLFISPMFFFSGVFYPVSGLGRWAELVAWCFPLTHLANLSRAVLGAPGAVWWPDLLWLLVFAALALRVAFLRMAARFSP